MFPIIRFALASLLLARTDGLRHADHSRCEGIPSKETVPYIEFGYLAASAGQNLLQDISALGWTPGTVVQDTSIGHDLARVYKKGCNGNGFCDACAIAFGAANDDYDNFQTFNDTKTSFCGVEGVGGGFVDELRGFFRAPTWNEATLSLSGGACGQVYSIGHSLGGAIASLFAFCVNNDMEGVTQDKPYVAGIPKVRLVTLGALAVSAAPLWSGKPGNCFDGARLFIGDSQKDPSAQFQLKALDFAAETYKLLGRGAEGEHVQSVVIPQLEQLVRINQWAVLWEQLRVAQLQIIGPITGLLAAAAAGTPGLEPITAMANDLVKQYAQELFFEYDAVPAVLQPLRHPLMQTVKLSHPMSRSGAPTKVWSTAAGDFTVFDEESHPGPACNPEASSWPSKPLAQAGFASFVATAQGIGLPNHQTCCYVGSMGGGPLAKNCESRFTVPAWFMCREPKWR